jgi:hypothetical protein
VLWILDRMIDFDSRKIGHLARAEFDVGGEFTVLGQSSQGVFLLAPSKRVVFLAYFPQIGPLTFQVGTPSKQLLDLQSGDKVVCRAGSLFMPSSSIRYEDAAIWFPTPPQPSVKETQFARLAALVEALKEPDEPNSLYPVLVNLILKGPKNEGQSHRDQESISSVISLLSAGDGAGVAKEAILLLGKGRGLTPSGDDFAVGLLLAITRYGYEPLSDVDLQRLKIDLLAAAEKKTTHLSISMIWTAGKGEGDSRLIEAVDHLFAGVGNSILIAHRLNAFGSSSGVDTLCGMAVVILAER